MIIKLLQQISANTKRNKTPIWFQTSMFLDSPRRNTMSNSSRIKAKLPQEHQLSSRHMVLQMLNRLIRLGPVYIKTKERGAFWLTGYIVRYKEVLKPTTTTSPQINNNKAAFNIKQALIFHPWSTQTSRWPWLLIQELKEVVSIITIQPYKMKIKVYNNQQLHKFARNRSTLSLLYLTFQETLKMSFKM